MTPCNTAFDALEHSNTSTAVIAANASMASVMEDLDTLLGSSSGFLLGRWLDDARALADGPEALASDGDFLEWNARAQVTSWSPIVTKGTWASTR